MGTAAPSSPSRDLRGRALRPQAYAVAREIDPERRGFKVRDLVDALEQRGFAFARGYDNRGYRTVYDTLKNAQHLFEHSPGGTWRWKEETPRGGVGGRDLERAAYDFARSVDPTRRGLHYMGILAGLRMAGVDASGSNPGQSVNTVLGSSDRFEWVEEGVYRWR